MSMLTALFTSRIGKPFTSRHANALDVLNVDLASPALSTEGKTPAQLKEVCDAQAALLVKQRDVLAQQRELIDTQRQQIEDQKQQIQNLQSQVKVLEQLVAQQKKQIAQPKAKAAPAATSKASQKAAPAVVELPKRAESDTAAFLKKLLGVR